MNERDARLPKELLAKIHSKRAEDREQAEQALEALGPEAVEALMEVMERESRNRQRRRMAGWAIICCWLLLTVVLTATGKGSDASSYTGSFFGLFASMFAVSQLHKNAASALARYDDVRAVGFLAEALEFDDKGVAQQAQEALIRLLPRLKATDHGLLTDEQRRCLDRALLKHRSAELSLAILTAYEQVGDPTSVPVVEKLAAGEVRRIRDDRVIQKARDVLPVIRERAEKVWAAQTLLRPVETAGADTLLRPADGAPTGPTEWLLRPADGEAIAPEEAVPVQTEAPEPERLLNNPSELSG